MTRKTTSQNMLQFGFFAFFAIVIALVVNETSSNKSFDTRSKAAMFQPITIQSLRVENISASEADVKWVTNVPTTSYVAYDLTAGSFLGTPETWGKWTKNTDNQSPSSMVFSHSIRLPNLTPNTTYFVKVAGRNYPKTGIFAFPDKILVFTTRLTGPKFTIGPNIDYPARFFSPNNFAFTAAWGTSIPTVFIEGMNSDLSKILSPNPVAWINEWGGSKIWTPNYSYSHQSPATFQPVYGKKYYYRIAIKDQSNLITYSDIFEITKLPPTPTPIAKPNCCGYNNSMQTWFCYTGCTGYNSSTTTVYPNKTCSTSSQCQ